MISHAPIIIQKSINIYVKRLFLILPLTQFTMTIDKERLLASPFKIIASDSQNKVHVDNTIFSKLYLSYTINMLKSKPRINPKINSKSQTGWRNHCNIKCTWIQVKADESNKLPIYSRLSSLCDNQQKHQTENLP